ncbi:MAG: group III truncated hemoglobin [Capnocytophaga sp.]|nr:group III truncated hemoglobin [Capnocytophaga sp.]
MHDIETQEDIRQMVDSFYDKVNKDEGLSYIFNDFAKINWATHLPIMYAFWSKLLLGEGDYRGNPFQKHIPLPIESHHFDRWVEIFKQNIDEQFIGEIAEEAKLRAENIAYVFDNKLSMLKLEY